MNLIERITEAIVSDLDVNLDNQSERLQDLYAHADAAGRELLDQALICICGWSFSTLLSKETETQ